jgi:hypothetical protein
MTVSGKPLLPRPQLTGMSAEAGTGREPEVTLADFSGARMLVSDARIGLLLLNDARDRVVEWCSGFEGAVSARGADRARDQHFGSLLAITVLGALLRPALSGTVRGVSASSHPIRIAFNHRHGHLIGPSRHRQDAYSLGARRR